MSQPVEAKKKGKKAKAAAAASSPVPSASPDSPVPSASPDSPAPASDPPKAGKKKKATVETTTKASDEQATKAKEKAEKEAKEKEKAAKEKAEKEAKEKAEKEAKEKAEKEAKEKAEKEKEKKEKEEKEVAKPEKKKTSLKKKKIEARLVNSRKANERKSNARKKLKEKLRKAKEKEFEKEEKLRKQKAEDDTPENRKHGEEKLKWLERQSAASSYGIISLDTEQYKEYVNSGPRPYWLLVEYTALHPSSRCGICETMNNAIRPVSQSMWRRRDIIKEKWQNQTDDEYYPIFFVQVDVQRNQQLFGQLQLNSAPLVSLIPPKLSNKKVAINQLLPKLKKYRFTAISATMTSQDIGDFVFKLTKLDVELDVVINYSDTFFIIALGAVALYVVYTWLDVMRQHRYFFFGAVLLAYLYCMGGGVYNHLRNTPWSQQQGDSVTYIARASRGQYAAETWILMIVIGGASFFGIQANRTMWRDSTTKGATGGWLIPFIYAALFALCYYFLLYIYNLKTWGYNMGWVI